MHIGDAARPLDADQPHERVEHDQHGDQAQRVDQRIGRALHGGQRDQRVRERAAHVHAAEEAQQQQRHVAGALYALAETRAVVQPLEYGARLALSLVGQMFKPGFAERIGGGFHQSQQQRERNQTERPDQRRPQGNGIQDHSS